MPANPTIPWPEAALGCQLRSAYRLAPEPRFREMEVEDGPARRRITSMVDRLAVDVAFNWTAAQLAAFEDFVFVTLRAGSLWFSMPLDTGRGMAPHVVHLTTNSRTIKPVAGHFGRFEVAFSLDAWRSATTAAPPFQMADPIDAGVVTQAVVDIQDARSVAVAAPQDIVNSLGPGAG